MTPLQVTSPLQKKKPFLKLLEHPLFSVNEKWSESICESIALHKELLDKIFTSRLNWQFNLSPNKTVLLCLPKKVTQMSVFHYISQAY